MLEAILVFACSVVAGAVASVAGFGIGSILTPLFAWMYGAKLAVAIVSVPHFIATALRCVLLRQKIAWGVLKGFGVMSALGGLTGALLHVYLRSPWLGILLGVLILWVALAGLTGWLKHIKFEGKLAWYAGAVSGFLGGMVGNQGGIRSGAMLGLRVQKETFVATATAIGVLVDVARMPVYLATQTRGIAGAWVQLSVSVVGCVIGTFLGLRFLKRVPEETFYRVVCLLLLLLGGWLIAQSLAEMRAA